MLYRCQHCMADLGQVIEGGPEPACPDHPHGGVIICEEADDGDSQPA
jgi:hypothetical protein